jgi:electron transport complex protein RnfD
MSTPPLIQPAARRMPATEAPFLRAPEASEKVYGQFILAALAPLVAGCLFMGFRALLVAVLAVLTCVICQRLYYRATRQLARSELIHAVLTGLLLTLILPAFVPWYVPVTAALLATVLGKAIFGGVGNFLWQPALLGWLAVMILFPASVVPTPDQPDAWPVLTRGNLLVGDITRFAHTPHVGPWEQAAPLFKADAIRITRPLVTLKQLTYGTPDVTPRPDVYGQVAFGSFATVRPDNVSYPAAIARLPTMGEMVYGPRPGNIGETSAIVIAFAGLWLIYRHLIKWQLPFTILLSAAITAAILPIHVVRQGVVYAEWLPITAEGLDVGITYVMYQVLSGGLLLAAVFLATETTSRPVTTGGQIIFGVFIGVGAMLLRFYTPVTGAAYIAVIVMNTFGPLIDRLWRPKIYGQSSLDWLIDK